MFVADKVFIARPDQKGSHSKHVYLHIIMQMSANSAALVPAVLRCSSVCALDFFLKLQGEKKKKKRKKTE